MKLKILRELRSIAKNKIDGWIGMEGLYYCNGKWHVRCIVWQIDLYRMEIVFGDEVVVKKLGSIKRIPMYVVYADSAIKEIENAEKLIEGGEFSKAMKSLWGSVFYALKAYGLVSKGCRIVEFSVMELAREFSRFVGDETLFDKIRRIKAVLDPFEILNVDVHLMQVYAVEVVEKVVERLYKVQFD